LLGAVGLPLVLALSYVFYWYCERPFLHPGSKTALEREVPAGAVLH
ncbi:MAG: hypothetical protein ICV83_33625, partial [Cytophagales bacterium]|nr:hypothetical protein [Cytophagales bacterium]